MPLPIPAGLLDKESCRLHGSGYTHQQSVDTLSYQTSWDASTVLRPAKHRRVHQAEPPTGEPLAVVGAGQGLPAKLQGCQDRTLAQVPEGQVQDPWDALSNSFPLNMTWSTSLTWFHTDPLHCLRRWEVLGCGAGESSGAWVVATRAHLAAHSGFASALLF